MSIKQVNLFKNTAAISLSDGLLINKPKTNIKDLAVLMLRNFVEGQLTSNFKQHSSLIGTARTLVGGDPEFFIEKDNKTIPSFKWFNTNPNDNINFNFFNGHLVPVIKSPFNLTGMFSENNYYYCSNFVHPDGYQLELGYFPAYCMEVTTGIISNLFYKLQNNMSKQDLKLSNKTSTTLTEKEANLLPLGCRPSFNAHFIDNTIYDANPLQRFAGGHFHFSALGHIIQNYVDYSTPEDFTVYDLEEINDFNSNFTLEKLNMEERIAIVNPIIKALDASIGVLSVAIAGELDDPARRHHHYGMAGDYRITQRTIEYRTPSNVSWQSPVVWNIMGMIGREIVKTYLTGNNPKLRRYFNKLETYPEIIDIINNTNVVAARKYINKNLVPMLELFDNYALIDYNYRIKNLACHGFSQYFKKSIFNNWTIHPFYLSQFIS